MYLSYLGFLFSGIEYDLNVSRNLPAEVMTGTTLDPSALRGGNRASPASLSVLVLVWRTCSTLSNPVRHFRTTLLLLPPGNAEESSITPVITSTGKFRETIKLYMNKLFGCELG